MAIVILGQIVHTKSLNDFEVLTNGFVAFNNGKIIGVGSNYSEWKAEMGEGFKCQEHALSSSQFLMPGFIDCHIHAPQMPQIGLGLDKPLMEWLESYTFPLEAHYGNTTFAQNIYEKVVRSTINCGTTLASYFATNHKNSSIILAKEAIRQGQRAFVGKVCSDSNSPSYYIENCNDSLKDTREFVEEVLNLNSDLVKPVITPRFAVSCSKKLLNGLGEIANKNNLNIQSHISENISEIEFVRSIFGKLYAEVYEEAKLLTNKCIMAHAVHLEDKEIELLKKHGTSVAHCPASNTLLSSGLCNIKRLLDNGIYVGLGTDVSGGNSPSIKSAILNAMEVSQHIGFLKSQDIKGVGKLPSSGDEKYTPLNYKQALFLATLGGANALGVEKVVGNFICGKDFDALVIDIDRDPTKNLQLPYGIKESSSEDQLLELIQKFVYVGDDRNIIKVFVNGKEIK